jgi:hypothetical protein
LPNEISPAIQRTGQNKLCRHPKPHKAAPKDSGLLFLPERGS